MTDLIQKDERGNYIEHVDKKQRSGRLIHKKGPRGTLPTRYPFIQLPVMSLQDYKDEEEEEANRGRKEEIG